MKEMCCANDVTQERTLHQTRLRPPLTTLVTINEPATVRSSLASLSYQYGTSCRRPSIEWWHVASHARTDFVHSCRPRLRRLRHVVHPIHLPVPVICEAVSTLAIAIRRLACALSPVARRDKAVALMHSSIHMPDPWAVSYTHLTLPTKRIV